METKVLKHLSGIKLKKDGMKGLEISYSHQEEKDGKTWNVEDWENRKMPIGEKLEEVVKAFRYYLLDIYGYEMENVNVADCKILEIEFLGSVRLIGELKILNGTRSVKMDTKAIDGTHEYAKMEELRNLVGQLKDELLLYMDGKSVMSESQLVMNFYKSKGKFDEVEFAGMSDEDKKKEATAILEKMGSIVIHNDDMDVSGASPVSVEAKIEPVLNVVNSEPNPVVNTPAEVLPSFDAEPVAYVEEVKPEDILVSEDEDGELVFAITPING